MPTPRNNAQQQSATLEQPTTVVPPVAPVTEPTNLVSDGKVIASTQPVVPIFGDVLLKRGSLNVSDRWGRSVAAVDMTIKLPRVGLQFSTTLYGRLNDKTGKIAYTPSLPRGIQFADDSELDIDGFRAHVVAAIKRWPDWSNTQSAADYACRHGKVKTAKIKNADGTETELETMLESEAVTAPAPAAPAAPETSL